MKLARVLLLALFALGQAAVSVHAHAFAVGSRQASILKKAAHAETCRVCELASVSRCASVNAGVAAPISAHSFVAVAVVAADPVPAPAAFHSARAPPAA